MTVTQLGGTVAMIAATAARRQICPVRPCGGAVEGRYLIRLGGRLGGSAHHFAGGADHPIRFELGNRLLILLVAPIDITALVDGSRRAE